MGAERYAGLRAIFLTALILIGAVLGGLCADRIVLSLFVERAHRSNADLINHLRVIAFRQRPLFRELGDLAADCSPETLGALRRALYAQPGLRDIAIVRDGSVACSAAFGELAAPVALPEPFAVTPRGVVHHLWSWPSEGGAEVLSARYGPFEFIYNEDAIVHSEDRDRLSLALIDEALRPRTFFGRPAPDGMAFSIIPASITRQGVVHVYACGGDFFVCAIRSADMAALRGGLRGVILGGVVAGVFLGALIGAAIELGVIVFGRPRSRARRLLRRGRYHFRYQPIIDLRTGDLTGAEALLRPDPGYEDVPVALIIDQAEKAGLTGRLLNRAAQAAVRDLGHRLRAGDFRVTLNTAARDLLDPGLPDCLDGVCRASRVPEDALALELTERSPIDTPDMIAAVKTLRERGYRLAIDDFGAGYANLSYLGALDVHMIKIDRTLVAAAGTGSTQERVVVHIATIAKELGLQVLAEGVETEAQAIFFRDLGAERAQGWCFAKAMTPDDFDAWAIDWRTRKKDFAPFRDTPERAV